MKQKILSVVWWLLSSALIGGLAIGIHYWLDGALTSFELWTALGLLGFNHVMFGLAARLQAKTGDAFGLIYGLLWIMGKLFVNTFTIFLLIGLQAVRSPVFVPVFFITYTAVLAMGILRLHLISIQTPNLHTDERRTER
ncbi:MAG: hypothetical protein JJU29_01520 [Verrucomicrobia bacterium]|nr:hypothetical protein [Verrucomicrobiota bacterium]MCH8512002.1 hypothetical protein [Kiritimatiellia bacterium]